MVSESLARFLSELKKEGPLTDWEVPYFKKIFYAQMFGINERHYFINDKGVRALKRFNEKTKPLSMISKNAREGLTEDEQIRIRAMEYRTYKIREVQGMSFIEWMSLPPHLMEGFLSDIKRERAAAASEAPPAGGPILDGPVSPEQALYERSTALR